MVEETKIDDVENEPVDLDTGAKKNENRLDLDYKDLLTNPIEGVKIISALS